MTVYGHYFKNGDYSFRLHEGFVERLPYERKEKKQSACRPKHKLLRSQSIHLTSTILEGAKPIWLGI